MRFPLPVGGCCIAIGCGFGDANQRLAKLIGPRGLALCTDSSWHVIEDARRDQTFLPRSNKVSRARPRETRFWP